MCINPDMKSIAIIIFSILSLIIPLRLKADPSIRITDIPNLKKLPVNAIHRIFQDKEGYMWYGTVNGLCRDDGYQIKIFRTDYKHRGLLADNLVECICEDRKNRIWFGTDKGLYCLDKKDYRITRVSHPLLDNQMIYQLYQRSNGEIWVSVNGYILRFDSNRQLVKVHKTFNGHTPTNLSGFCEGHNGEIIVSFSQGLLYRYDGVKDTLVAYPDLMKAHNPGAIIADRTHKFYWLGTWGDGIVKFTPTASKDSMFVYFNPVSPEFRNILYLAQKSDGNEIWCTSSTHLVTLSLTNGSPRLMHLYPQAPHMLNEIIRDRNNDFWVSGFDLPSFIVHFDDDAPTVFQLNGLRRYSEYQPAIMTISDCDDQTIWLFQERAGLFLYDLKSNQCTSHKDFKETASLPFHLVKIMNRSQMAHAVWIAPENQKQIFRLTHEHMKMSLKNAITLPDSAINDAVTCVYENKKGTDLWIGTRQSLYKYNLQTKRIIRLPYCQGQVNAISETDDQTIWIATNGKGVYALPTNGPVLHYQLKHVFSCLTATTDNLIWLGSHEGDLLCLNPLKGSITNYTSQCGLEGHMVNYVVCDEFNHLWIGTNQKLTEFNPQNNSFRTYLTTEGQTGLWRFIPTSWCKSKDEQLYFGGIPGICRFKPSNSLDLEASNARTYITDIKANERSLLFDDHQSTDSIIVLQHNDNNITISFSSLDLRQAHNIRYAYRLNGMDNTWQYTTDGTNTAIYNRLPKGHYTFEVKATDHNGQWSTQSTLLEIDRKAALYETWWAYLIYIILTGGTTISVILWYIKKIKRRNEELWADSAEMVRMKNYLNHTVQHNDQENEKLDRLFTDKIISIIENHLCESEFGVPQLASAMNMSRSTLTRKLKSLTGKTPLDIIRNIKMEHAKRMLEEGHLNIGEVSTSLGYQNRKYFTNCFKEEFGMTPSEYQKNMKKEQTDKTASAPNKPAP